MHLPLRGGEIGLRQLDASVCRIWYGRTVIGPKQAFGGVLVWAEDEDERAYAVAWVEEAPEEVRRNLAHVLDTLWVSGRTIIHEALSALAGARMVGVERPHKQLETDDIQAAADAELVALGPDGMTKLDQMANLISQFADRRMASRARRVAAMGTLLTQVNGLRARRIAERPGSFNTLSLLRVENAEEVHSGFLAWLLDANESHGCGALFAETLIGLICLSVDLRDRYRVRTEFAGLESIIDVLVARDRDFLLYIENKVWSTEGIDQLAREYRDMCRVGQALRVPESKRVAVFLTPAGLPPTTADGTPWRTLAYRDLAAAFTPLLPQVTIPKTRLVIEDWLSIIGSWTGVTPDVDLQ